MIINKIEIEVMEGRDEEELMNLIENNKVIYEVYGGRKPHHSVYVIQSFTENDMFDFMHDYLIFHK